MSKLPTLKRPIPALETLAAREAMLREMRNLPPTQIYGQSPAGLNYGNTKLGRTGSKYKTIFVWNIPAVVTCPGASEACLRYCYNADERKDLFPIEAWNENLAWFRNEPLILMEKINSQLAEAEARCAVRIHSSGDFFSSEYISFWDKIARSNPSTTFWAYTRSWRIPILLKKLEALRALPNVELFASWDDSMDAPPARWRLSLVTDDQSKWADSVLSKRGLFLCPEQIGVVANCASCGLCMKRDTRGVLFTLH